VVTKWDFEIKIEGNLNMSKNKKKSENTGE